MTPEITCLTEHHPLPDGELRLLGAVDRVTPSCTLVETGGARLLVDCGVPPADGTGAVDAVILTHAHADHVAGLPELQAAGYEGPVICTPATAEIARSLIADGVRLEGGDGRRVSAALARFDRALAVARYDEPARPVDGAGVSVILREAGHILGSASVEILSEASRVIVSGDLGRPGSPILRDYHTAWDEGRPVDLVLVEATYGDRPHADEPGDVRQRLGDAITRALADGGHILIPAFAIGRTQLLLYHLNALVESGAIEDLPVAVDTPLGLRITGAYSRHRRLYDREALARIARGDDPLDFEELYAVRRGRDSVRLRDADRPLLIIAGSGMCVGGRIVGHLRELLPRPETCVLFVGYQAAGTPGRAIQDAAAARAEGEVPRVEIDGRQVRLAAAVETINGISAHAGKRELTAWIDAVPAPRRVALHHGGAGAQRAFAEHYRRHLEERAC